MRLRKSTVLSTAYVKGSLAFFTKDMLSGLYTKLLCHMCGAVLAIRPRRLSHECAIGASRGISRGKGM